MNIFNKRTIYTLILCFASSAGYADSFFGDDEDAVWQSGYNRYVKYAPLDRSTAGNNEHPITLKQADVSNALKAIEYTKKNLLGAEQIKVLFSDLQISLLSKTIVKGLKNANPDQDLIFSIEGTVPKLLVLSDKTYVGGRIFFKDKKLNIIIGDYNLVRNKAVEQLLDPADNSGITYDLNHGRRSKESKSFKGTIGEIPGIQNKKTGKKFRNDWFVIDVEYAAKAYLAAKEGRNNPSSKQDRNLQIEAAKLARERREMRAEMARMRKEMKEINSGGNVSSSKSPEERIATLDQLLAKELITEEEYKTRRKEILNDI